MSDSVSSIISAAAPIASAGSSLVGSIISAAQAKKAREMQQQMYEEQFAYAKQQDALRMEREDTAIQRQMADLEAAGINPLLAGNLGGAAANAGATISGIYTPAMSNAGDIIAQGGANVGRLMQDYSRIDQGERMTQAQTAWLDTHKKEVEQYIMSSDDKDQYWQTWREMNQYERWEAAKFIEQTEEEAIGYMTQYADRYDDEEAKKIKKKIESTNQATRREGVREAFKYMNRKEGEVEGAKNMVEDIMTRFKDSTGKVFGGKIVEFGASLFGGGVQTAFDYAKQSRLEQKSLDRGARKKY